ncbi:hypothetical protein [Cohnella zeiphila]|uniref:Uncharacterized protein n=1 Tax=Cohnella zeiphila TaxID=2761120 RepID=A0A7X0ST64_9BACL|nr:hypothetical protein [Cohnella zeiphila]MBB6735657.1 hypothetical protein [Cohnella zeiphila]
MNQLPLSFSPAERFIRKIAANSLGACPPTAEVHAVDDHTVRYTIAFSLSEEVRQDDWQLRIEPSFEPSFHWAPHLTPTDRHVIDQHVFRSPALIVHDGRRMLALVPDLDLLTAGSPVRWYLDLDAERNRLTLGMSRSEVTEHVLFERAPGAVYPAGTVRIGFYLMAFEDERALRDPWRPVLAFLWSSWGTKRFRQGAPEIGPMSRYVRHTYDWAFKHWEDIVWQEFELNGRKVGAPAFIVDVSQSPNYPGIASERESRSIWNQAWFSSLRSAIGLYRFGRSTGDEDLVRRALLTKELALAAPMDGGFFPTVIATEMEEATVDGQSINRSKGWKTAFWGNSNRNPVLPWGSIGQAPYHVLDMSWTCLLMLRWYEELEPDPRLLAYAEHYAEALMSLQDEDGFFPAWLEREGMQPIEVLAQSPETSLSVTFLLKLHELHPDGDYLTPALKAMDAVLEHIVPVGRWEDFETYWSCCGYGRPDLVGRKVARNDMFKQCNFSTFWTAEALLGCYKATGEERYLAAGRTCLDEMLMTQASWQPPYIPIEALGGFGVMNADGEWNDARQSLFAELILEYGMELDQPEYIERGIAALRASFVMMYCPENVKTREQWEKAYPFFNEKDYGFMMENYGHGGEVNAEGLGMGTFTIYDWGNGATAEAYLRILEHHGEILRERYGWEI